MGIERMRTTNYHSKRVCYMIDLLKADAIVRLMTTLELVLATVEQNDYLENVDGVLIVNYLAIFRLF